MPRQGGWLRLTRGLRRQRGVAALELALITPVMVLIVVGGVDLYRYVQARSLIDRVAFTIAHEFSQTPGLPYGPQCNGNRTAAGCGAHVLARELFRPLQYAATDVRIAVYRAVPGQGVWTPCWPVTGSAPDTASLPPAPPIANTLIAVTTSYRYSGNALPDTTLRARAYSRATGVRAEVLCP